MFLYANGLYDYCQSVHVNVENLFKMSVMVIYAKKLR